jgi:hypothetical protein
MKFNGSIRVVRIWCGIRTDPVLRCFMDSKGLNYEVLLVSMVPELVTWLTV